MKKIIKFILLFIFLFFLFNILDVLLNQINHINEISNQYNIKIYDKDNEIIYQKNNINDSSYVSIDNINEITKNVFIEIEDRRFYLHPGIDFYGISNAFLHNLNSDYKIGGSTITQQYVKNLYFSNEKTYLRKIKECYYAIRIEQLYSKEEILEGYLNTIYFNNGIYGINDAAHYYFNKTPNDLTLKEAVSLVSIIKSPSTYCPINNFDNNQNRSKTLLTALYDRDVITKKDYNNAISQELIITKSELSNYPSSILYFKDYVLSNINASNKELDIYTNFNTDLNLYIDGLANNISCDIAIVVLDKNGYIVSTIGNKNYFETEYNIATYGKRMVGSAIKPMLYYEALCYGMIPSNTFISEKKDLIVDNEIISISNFNDRYDNAPINMNYAIATSDNIFAIKTHLFIGTNKLPSFLEKFNIEPINDKYTICLGTQDMSLLSLTNIYNTFLNEGEYSTPKSYTKFLSGETYSNNLPLKKQLLNKDTCNTLNNLMKGTFDTSLNGVNNVTGSSIAHLLNKEVSGKSGLTDYDSYMIGSTDNYTIGIWAGHSDNSLLTSNKNKKLPKELFYKIVNYL